MSRQTITDNRFRALGYIDTLPDGRLKALSARFEVLGYYDPKSDNTFDAGWHLIGKGNQLSALIRAS